MNKLYHKNEQHTQINNDYVNLSFGNIRIRCKCMIDAALPRAGDDGTWDDEMSCQGIRTFEVGPNFTQITYYRMLANFRFKSIK